jgi:hypothetical protein
VNFWFEESLP